VTARSRACDQGFFPAARCSAPRGAGGPPWAGASSIRRAPARIPASTSAGLNTPAGRRARETSRAEAPSRPRYSGTTNTSWPASWTSIISFTTNGLRGRRRKRRGSRTRCACPEATPSGRRASRDGGRPAGMRGKCAFQTANDEPQPQVCVAFGFENWKPPPWRARHEVDLGYRRGTGALLGSTRTRTPSYSSTWSSSRACSSKPSW